MPSYTMPTPGTISRPRVAVPTQKPTQKSWRLELAEANEQYRYLLSEAARLTREAAESDSHANICRYRAAHYDRHGLSAQASNEWDASWEARERAVVLRAHASLRRDEAAEVAKPWTVVRKPGGAIVLG